MKIRKRLVGSGAILSIALSLTAPACKANRPGPPPTTAAAPTTAPTPEPVATFDGSKFGVCFKYPADWKPDCAQTAVFAVAAPQPPAKSYSSLSLDVPKLPWHIPGMITPNMVANGYLDDMKKSQMPDATVESRETLQAAGEKACRLYCRGHENGKEIIDEAVFIVHADRVYIFSLDADPAGYSQARKALDTAVGSIEWVGK